MNQLQRRKWSLFEPSYFKINLRANCIKTKSNLIHIFFILMIIFLCPVLRSALNFLLHQTIFQSIINIFIYLYFNFSSIIQLCFLIIIVLSFSNINSLNWYTQILLTMILFDFSFIDSDHNQHKRVIQHKQVQLQVLPKKVKQIMRQQNKTLRESAQSYSSHHTSSIQSNIGSSKQSIKQYQDVNLRRDQLYSKSVYEAPTFLKSNKKNFESCFREDVIIQFYNAYLPLIQLTPFLQMIQKIYARYHKQTFKHGHDSIQPQPMPYQIQNELAQVVEAIRQILFISQKKYQMFLKFKLASVLFDWNLLIKVLIQISEGYNQQVQLKTQDRCQRRHYIKQIIKVIYTNLNYMMDYIRLNEQTFYYLRKKLTKFLMPRITYLRLDNKTTLLGFAHKNRRLVRSQYRRPTRSNRNPNDSESSLLSDVMQTQSQNEQYAANNTERKISKLFDILNSSQNLTTSSYKQLYVCLQNSIKQLFQSIVSNSNYQKKQKLQAYSTVARKTQSHKNHFLMGLYIGLGSITLFALIILLIFNLIQFNYDQNRVTSMNYIFPMFRGIGLLILYLWGVAWNVYGFTKFRINHRLILQYGSHYSTHFQIMKRAGFFTLVFSAMLLIYCIVQSTNIAHQKRTSSDLTQYTPFFVWTLYFAYIFFPNRDVFNPQGRRYFYDLLKKIFFSPIIKVTFLITWASDQAVSFVIPIKDFAYTICFYTSNVSIASVQDCLKGDHFQGAIVTYIVAILPLFLRMIQCYRQAKQQNGKFIGHLQMWNFLKYFSSVLTATTSYLTTLESSFFTIFVISSVVSTSYSYYWDLKNDWGFLQKNSKHRFLRNQLSYKNPKLYYLAITFNLLFRCSWTLTISASIVELLHRSTFLPFLTGFIQIFRRCMWNFIRVQKQHLANCKDYVIMKPSVQRLVQKLKKRQRQARIESLQPHFEVQLGYSQKVKRHYVQSIKQQQNLIQFFGQKQYELQWKQMSVQKVQAKKKEFLQLLQRQKSIFKENKSIVLRKFNELEELQY